MPPVLDGKKTKCPLINLQAHKHLQLNNAVMQIHRAYEQLATAMPHKPKMQSTIHIKHLQGKHMHAAHFYRTHEHPSI
jgi:hypothetical protein